MTEQDSALVKRSEVGLPFSAQVRPGLQHGGTVSNILPPKKSSVSGHQHYFENKE